jgi:DNA-binding NarL/FixJ family response regulator
VAAPIRIVLVDMPRLLRDLIEHALSGQPDMVVVAAEPDVEALGAAARESEADFVIVGLEHGRLPGSAQELLDERARQRVLGVEAENGEAVLYELRPRRTPIGRASPAELATAIRAAAGAP